MRPVLFTIPLPVIGPLAVKSYGVMLMLAFMVVLCLALWRAKREKVNPNVIWDVWVYALLGGIIGSRALYLLENLDRFSGRLLDIFKIWEGGLSFYGGFAVATASIWLILWLRKIAVLKICDILAASLILGMTFGKVGCFLNGCCFGRPTESFIGVSFPAHSPIDSRGNTRMSPAYQWQLQHELITSEATRSLRVHPVQLYESAAAIVIFAVLLLFYPHRRRFGEVAYLLGMVYSAVRFCLEFFREKQIVMLYDLTPEQVFSIVSFVVFATLFIVLRRKRSSVIT